jgi:hypothetical protein
MKRILLVAFLLFSSIAFGQNLTAYNGKCSLGGQTTVTQGLPSSGTQVIGATSPTLSKGAGVLASYPRCTVAVFLTGTTNVAPIYSNNLTTPTPLANPFQANTDSSFLFYFNGVVDVTISSSTSGGPPMPNPFTFVAIGGSGGSGPSGGSGVLGPTSPTPACPVIYTAVNNQIPTVASAITYLNSLGCPNSGIIWMTANEDWPQGGGPFAAIGWSGLLYAPNAVTSNGNCGQVAVGGVWNCITTEGPIILPGRVQIRGAGASGSTNMGQGTVFTTGATYPAPLGQPTFNLYPTCEASGTGSFSTAPTVTVALVRNGLGAQNTPLTYLPGMATLPFTALNSTNCNGTGTINFSINSLGAQTLSSISGNGTIATVTFPTAAKCNEVTGNKVLISGTGTALDGQTLTVNSPGCQDRSFTGLTASSSGSTVTVSSGTNFDSNFVTNGQIYLENCVPQVYNTLGQLAQITGGGSGTGSLTFISTTASNSGSATGCNAVTNGVSFTANSSIVASASAGTVTNSRCGICTSSNDPTYGAYDVEVFTSPREAAIASSSVSSNSITVNVANAAECVFTTKWQQVIFHGTSNVLVESQVGTVTNVCTGGTSFKVKPNTVVLGNTGSLTSTGTVSQWPYGPGTEIQVLAANLTCPNGVGKIDANACSLNANGNSGTITISNYSSSFGVTIGIASPLADLSNYVFNWKRGLTNGFDTNLRDLSIDGSPTRLNPTALGAPILNNAAGAIWNPICQEECGVKEVNMNGTFMGNDYGPTGAAFYTQGPDADYWDINIGSSEGASLGIYFPFICDNRIGFDCARTIQGTLNGHCSTCGTKAAMPANILVVGPTGGQGGPSIHTVHMENVGGAALGGDGVQLALGAEADIGGLGWFANGDGTGAGVHRLNTPGITTGAPGNFATFESGLEGNSLNSFNVQDDAYGTSGLYQGNYTDTLYTSALDTVWCNQASITSGPAICGAASSGTIWVTNSSYPITVDTTAVTATSKIYLSFEQGISSGGANCTGSLPSNWATLGAPIATTRFPGVSFNFQFQGGAPASNGVCVNYLIVGP